MRKSSVIVGMKVVVNDLPETTIYTIKKIDGFMVDLVYFEHGREIWGGQMDVSLIKRPTKEQLGV
jgi:hypothetical protein